MRLNLKKKCSIIYRIHYETRAGASDEAKGIPTAKIYILVKD